MSKDFTLHSDGIEPYFNIEYSNGHTDGVLLMYRHNTWFLDDGEVLQGRLSPNVIEAVEQKLAELNGEIVKEFSLESRLLWEAYMVLDHGEMEERLAMLDKLEKHFDEHGKPITK